MTSSSRNFRSSPSAPSISSSAAPLPFAPTLGGRPASRVSAPSSRLTTPLAAPPPPLVLAANPASTNEERKVRYAGAEHTLGPTFSEEEDGDDTEWIAGKMAAVLNMGGGQGSYGIGNGNGGHPSSKQNMNRADPHARARQHAQANVQAQYDTTRMQQQLNQQQVVLLQLQAQQQQLLQLIALAQQSGQPTHQYREAYAALQMQAQQYSANTAQIQAQAQLVMQAQAQRAMLAQQLQSPSYHQQSSPGAGGNDYRSALAAQVQANLLSRNSRGRSGQNQNQNNYGKPDDADIRARFESVPNPYITPQTASAPMFDNPSSPFGDLTWKSSTPKPSPFDQPARSAPPQTTRFDTPSSDRLPAFLARRRATDETSISGESEVASVSDTPGLTRAGTAQTSPNPSINEHQQQDRSHAQAMLGRGRPNSLLPSARSYTLPAQTAQKGAEGTPRSASHTGAQSVRTVLAVRQPVGPPGDPAELKEKNFQSRLRRQAGLDLGMLGRRMEGALTPTE